MKHPRAGAALALLYIFVLSPAAWGNAADRPVYADEAEAGFHARNERAMEHLERGNELAHQGMHREAIEEWEQAAVYRPDSNVPWNNMANSFTTLKMHDEALRVARKAFEIRIDHLSSTTLGNTLRGKGQASKTPLAGMLFEEAEHALRAGMEAVKRSGDKFEHPFWTLAMLLWDQGDYIEFLNIAKEGFDYLSREWCSPEDVEEGHNGSPDLEGACQVPDFEIDIAEKIYQASNELAYHAAGRGRYDEALGHLDWSEHIAQTYVTAKLDAAAPEYHRWCIGCAQAEQRAGGQHSCGDALQKCKDIWLDTNGRYLRMMAVRVMGCDWRVRCAAHLRRALPFDVRPPRLTAPHTYRQDDERDFARMCASPKMHALLNHTIEFYFECDDGRVCGAGAQPPLHMFGTPMSLEAVLVMGKVQPLQLLDTMLARDLPPPEWAYPSWNPRIGSILKIGFISSDLLRNHPVGNMMRHVLPLHDLSRMEVTLFIIHEQQRYQIQVGYPSPTPPYPLYSYLTFSLHYPPPPSTPTPINDMTPKQWDLLTY